MPSPLIVNVCFSNDDVVARLVLTSSLATAGYYTYSGSGMNEYVWTSAGGDGDITFRRHSGIDFVVLPCPPTSGAEVC